MPALASPLVRRSLLALAALGSLVMVAAATAKLLDVAARHTTVERRSFTGVRTLVVRRAGDVRLTGAPAGAPLRIVTRATAGLRAPERTARRDGGRLVLSSTCPVLLGDSCAVRYAVAVPPGVRLVVAAESGDVVAGGLRTDAPVWLRSAAGNVVAERVRAPSLRLESSAGDVVAEDVGTPRVTAQSAAGDVRVALSATPERLVAVSRAGDVHVDVPDAVYALRARSAAGEVEDRTVRTDPAAPRTIRAESSAGDVRVSARRR